AGQGSPRSSLLFTPFSLTRRHGCGALALHRTGEERVERGLGEHHVVVDQHVIGVELVGREQMHVRQVPCRKPAQLVVAVQHNQDPLRLRHRRESRLGRLRGRLLTGHQLGDDVDLPSTRTVGEGAAQSSGLHLLRSALGVVPRCGAVDRATTHELRRTNRALASTTGALLAVRLAATTTNLTAGLRVVCALTRCRHLGHHDLVHQRDVRLHVEDLARQFDGALSLARGGLQLDCRGHLVTPPFAALRTNTRPPLGPGTAPLIRSRPSSARTEWMVKPWVVTRLLPARPAIRLPLNTRPGVAAPPMEPGARCVAWLPWLAPWPAKPCRFMTPAKPLPLLVPVTSTTAPSENTSAVISWPTS